MRLGNDRFETDRNRIKSDWPGIIFQIEDGLRSGRTAVLSEGMHNELLRRIEAERAAYRADLERDFGRQHRELHERYHDQPNWPLIRADHWNQFRAEVRARMRWLDVWEEALDRAFVRNLAAET